MAKKIKHTKNELKAQRDALARFRRYLPTLELKKQQLLIEIRKLQARREERLAALAAQEREAASWLRLFAEPAGLERMLRLKELIRSEQNIAGVDIPIFRDAVFERAEPDLFATPPWVDDALDHVEKMVRLRLEVRLIEEGISLLDEELRITSQRVNLFEKVKIPEALENIRIIRIFMGDLETAAVARAKLAKGKSSQTLRSA